MRQQLRLLTFFSSRGKMYLRIYVGVLLTISVVAGAISTAVLPVRKITQLHGMMVNVLSLLKHLCEHHLCEDHWEESGDREEVSCFIPRYTSVCNFCTYVLHCN